jgi:acyl carrier protein
MSHQPFTIDDLMTLLVARVGLPPRATTTDPAVTFDDVGLDSLAFLQLQAELQDRFGCELPDDQPRSYTFAEITEYVNEHLSHRAAA